MTEPQNPHRRQVAMGAAALGSAAAMPKGICAMTADGLSPVGLARVREVLEHHIDHGDTPGLVAVVARGPRPEFTALGVQALGGAPVRTDTIFRLASMTKPVTAVAIMMLVEEGKLALDEPVERLLPELANRRVLRRLDGPPDDTVPAARPITVEDLLTFRQGFGIVFADPAAYPILQVIGDLAGFGMPDPAWPHGPDEWMRRLGTLPLMRQPGEAWMYTAGSNVLGVLIARASGQPLGQFFQARIFEPLGMADTGFTVPESKLDRFAAWYMPENGRLVLAEGAQDSKWRKPPPFPAGDSGLVSTAGDFLTFARMLANGGRHGDRRLVSAASVAAMTADHLTPAQRAGGADILGPFRGWGYGVGVNAATDGEGWPPGAYGWDGGFGTSWITDPKTGLIAILLTQRTFDGPDPPQVHKDFHAAAWRALA